METHSIISDSEALQILKNDLRRAALARRATEIGNATPEHRDRILSEIESEIRKELQRRRGWRRFLRKL